jgi:pimeloyl-ACP methyl ester carboxylesterase
LLVPSYLAPGERVPLVVLLHGLGETNQERAGAYAWLDRYGLGTAYERLRRPPITRTSTRGEWTDVRLAEVNASLAEHPFRGFAVACPYMPQLPAAQLDLYGKWLVDTLLPRVRSEAPVFDDAAHTIFGGCSLGGYASLEIFLRRPDGFAAWAGVQTAIGEAGAPGYAERLDAALKMVGPRALYVGTSIGDPYLKANQILGAALAKRGIARELRVSPGPHDQPWLREIGTVELLRWCDLAVPHSP